MADKSGESDELISQFMAFTGSADPEKAASYLEMSGNNVETAVGLFMEHEQGGGDLGGGGVASAVGGAGRTGDDIRAPDATRTMRLMDDDHRGPMMGMGMMGHMGIPQDPAYHLMSAMMEMDEQSPPSTFSVAAPDINIRASLDEAIAAQRQHSALQEGKDDGDYHDEDDDEDCEVVARPQEPARLSDMFAAPNHLLHRAGGFQGSRTMAKDTKRWLLVNIQRDAEFASHALNRDVWRDELVENLIREGFIFWQQMDGTPEGRTYTERYQVRDYPHIGIIDPRTGRLLLRREGWTQQNPMTAESFAEIAMDFCSHNSFDRSPQAPRPPGAPASPTRPAKRPMNEMSEAEQIQAAMEASIQLAGGGIVGDGVVDIQHLDSVDDNIDDDDEVQVVDCKPPAETTTTLNDELQTFVVPSEPADGSRIQMRMPDGKRAVRKFSASDSVRAIYAFIAQTTDEARGGREFVLMAGYPPRDMLNDIDCTIEDVKLSGEAITLRWK